MIKLTRITGEEILVNISLIEIIEHHSDTVISLTTGNKVLVKESLDEVIKRIVEHKSAIHKNANGK